MADIFAPAAVSLVAQLHIPYTMCILQHQNPPIVLLEANLKLGGSLGKAGNLLAKWATPECLAPLSFRAHAEMAESLEAARGGVTETSIVLRWNCKPKFWLR